MASEKGNGCCGQQNPDKPGGYYKTRKRHCRKRQACQTMGRAFFSAFLLPSSVSCRQLETPLCNASISSFTGFPTTRTDAYANVIIVCYSTFAAFCLFQQQHEKDISPVFLERKLLLSRTLCAIVWLLPNFHIACPWKSLGDKP